MNLLFKRVWPLLVVAGVFAASCSNQNGSEDWPPSVQEVEEAPVLSVEEALQSFSVPPGFRVEPVAAEPLIIAPVAMDIDADGRLWVVEMQSFMTDIEDTDSDFEPTSRIVVLEDDDDDGRMDRSTVFMDSLVLPRTVLAVDGGALVGEPPNLWFGRDTDGDLKADEKIRVRDDYGDPEGNQEAMANGLTWGMDNWIHNTHYAGRFRRAGDSWQYDTTRALGQWGVAMDDYGRYYRTWNADPLRVALLDPHYFVRNPDADDPGGVDERIARDAREVWPIRTTRGVNRGYQDDVLREDSTLRTFTAASAPAVYRGDRYPSEFRGDVFVPEPAGNLVRRFEITEHEDGTMEAANAYDQAEFMASTDERFRPVNLYSAPDGTLYIVDMYRGVLEHRYFLTQYLKYHILERGLQEHTGMGRIYRVVHESNEPDQEKPQLTARSSEELVEHLNHPNGWWRDTAQRLLVERQAAEVAPALRTMAQSSDNELARLHALWTLDGLGELDAETVTRALSDEAPHVRAAAVRLSEPQLQDGDASALQNVAALTQDPAPPVRLQLAASLGEVPPPAADSAMAALLMHSSEQPYLSDVVVTGLNGRELTFLQHLTRSEGWNSERDGYAQIIQTLAATIVNGGDVDEIDRMLQLAGDEAGLPQWQRLALLEGIEEHIPRPRGGVDRPLELQGQPASLAQVTQASDPEVRDKAEQIADRVVWPGKAGYEPQESLLVTEAHKERFERGRQRYQQTCATCHQVDGEGQEGVAASLVGSEWVLGDQRDLIRIVMGGKEGEEALMPPMGQQLSNEEIAAILTYVRNEWDNQASPVSPSLVEDVRRATASREEPWTEEELRTMLH